MKTYYNDVTCKYDNIIFDLDSTLVTIEGIDELARIKGVADKVVPVTQQAMNGELSLEDAFKARLAVINPTFIEVESLAQHYINTTVTGARDVISWLHQQHKQVFIVSGGYDPAVTKFAESLGLSADHIFANRLRFDETGKYLSLKETDYLWKEHGKTKIIGEIKANYPGKTVVIGDGISDLEAASVADEFICFAGVARRETVIMTAKHTVFDQDISEIIPFLI